MVSSPLTDMLIAATSLAPCVCHPELIDDTVTAVTPCQRLELSTESRQGAVAATAPLIPGLKGALAA